MFCYAAIKSGTVTLGIESKKARLQRPQEAVVAPPEGAKPSTVDRVPAGSEDHMVVLTVLPSVAESCIRFEVERLSWRLVKLRMLAALISLCGETYTWSIRKQR